MAEPIGRVETQEGTVTVIHADGNTGVLHVGDPVFKGGEGRPKDKKSKDKEDDNSQKHCDSGDGYTTTNDSDSSDIIDIN